MFCSVIMPINYHTLSDIILQIKKFSQIYIVTKIQQFSGYGFFTSSLYNLSHFLLQAHILPLKITTPKTLWLPRSNRYKLFRIPENRLAMFWKKYSDKNSILRGIFRTRAVLRTLQKSWGTKFAILQKKFQYSFLVKFHKLFCHLFVSDSLDYIFTMSCTTLLWFRWAMNF